MTGLTKARPRGAAPLRRRTLGIMAAIAAIGVYTTGCDVHGISDPGTLSSISVSPNPSTMSIGSSQQFTATAADFAGASVPVNPVWTVASGGGTITSGGMFTAGTVPGTYTSTIKATSGGRSAVATVTVTVGPLATITVTPTPVTLAPGATQQYVAVGKDSAGNVVQFTPTWSVVTDGGSINNTGLFTAGTAAGTFVNTVQASSGGLRGTATVTVSSGPLASITVTPNPATILTGAQQQFSAVGSDANGNTVAMTPIWVVVNGGGSVDVSSGLFTAGATAGTYTNTVRATSGSISGFATVVESAPPGGGGVVPGVITSITVTPNPAAMLTGATQQFAAIARDGNGTVVPFTPQWSVVAGGGAINSNGLFTAGNTTGTFTNTVKATGGGQAGFATVTISAVAPTQFINLGQAALNGIMAGTAVSCTGSASTINANVSISPGNTISGPCVVTGTQHLNDATAQGDQIALTAAYTAAAGKPCSASNVISGDLGGTTKAAGVYCAAALSLTGVLTLDGGGDPNASFLFQSGSSLIVAGNVVLINGAQAKNVYWQVGSSATLGTASQFQGNILALTSITLVTGTTLNGRALARNGAVSAGTGSVITLP